MLPVRRRLGVRKRNLLTVSSQMLQIIMQIRMGHPPGILLQEAMLPVAELRTTALPVAGQ